MFSRLHTQWTDILDNIRFLTLTSFANSFSLTSEVCKMFNAKVENDARPLIIPGYVQFLYLHRLPTPFSQHVSVNIGNGVKRIVILCNTSF